MLHNKKGAALLQVLLVTSVLAGLATMILRANLSRTLSARQTNRTTAAHMLINACQAEVNALWTAKKPDIFVRDMASCWMTCTADIEGTCVNGSNARRSHTCTIQGGGANKIYSVEARFTTEIPGIEGCKLEYSIKEKGASNLDEVPLY